MLSLTEAQAITFSQCKYPVYLFCKKHNIECGHDFNRDKGISWTEIYLDQKLVMQVDSGSSVEQFLKLSRMIYAYWENEDYDDGSDTWIACPEKQLFYRLLNRFHEIFLNENK